MPTITKRFTARRIVAPLSRLVALAAVWWIITEGAPGAWLIGVPAIILTSVLLARTATGSELRPRLSGLPGFVAFFAVQSLRGGMDVARRTVAPRLDLRPAILALEWRLPPGAPRTLGAIVMNLLPGTLTVQDLEHEVSVHVVDASASVEQELRRVEQHVAALFDVRLSPVADVR